VVHVAHLLLPAPFGGLERVVHLLSAELVGLGHRVTVGLLDIEGGAATQYAKLLQDDGIPTEKLAVTRRGYLAERRKAGRWLGDLRPDVLHTHGYRPDVVDAPAAHPLGIAHVTTFHGFIGNSRRERFYEWLQVRSARRADRVVAVSTTIRTRLERRGIHPQRIALLPNGYRAGVAGLGREEARKALGLASGRFVLGWVGRITHEKGLDIALRAHAQLAVPRPLLVVVGDGADRPGLRRLSCDLGTEEDVVWLGSVPSAGRYFRGFDALVVSSRSEGAPMVVLEAAGAEVPIVATRVGELANMTGDEGALLVEPDRPDELAAAIRLTVSEPDRGRTRAERARRRIEERFSPVTWAQRHVRLYQDALLVGRGATGRGLPDRPDAA
jgi:glycosyltransferase involved in cell wall biosynthesis